MEIPENLEIEKIVEYLSPNEIKIIPYLKEGSLEKIYEKTKINKTAIMRSLEFLANKKIINFSIKKEKIVDLGINGIIYLKNGLPERKIMNLILEKNFISLDNAKKETKLNDNEFKAAIGRLKKKLIVDLKDGNLILIAKKEEIIEKTLEEKFLESLPKNLDDLSPEEKYALENLISRKDILEIKEKKKIVIDVTELGEKLMKYDFSSLKETIENLTPEIIKKGSWKGKKFRKYDILSKVPKIYGGKKHFVNQAIEYARKIWLEMGFKEMSGNLVVSGFWNFDALFTAQDHPARELQDTFFIKDKVAELKEKKLIKEVKKAHEGKIKGSKGWNYEWKEEEARKVVLRTHTTCISSQTLLKIAKNREYPAKYFAIGKCFRNESLDATHGFEFNQTEGIVVDENANFRQLIGYLKEFFKKMGYENIRIRPSYFPYTEPSLEIDVFHPIFKKWVELGGAGIFRPEVTIPFFGKHIPVLAWGPGFDRIIMEFFNITDLREMYKNNLSLLREIKIWNI